MKKIFICIGALAMLGLGSCSKKYTQEVASTTAYHTPKPICMGIGHDGTQTIRVWGRASSESQAINQALKNAVYEVIFKGIEGTGECNQNPLVTEVNARERYSEYFDRFFSDGGEYARFVTENVGNKASRLNAKGSSLQSYSIIATVDRERLKKQLQADGIIKGNQRP